MDGDGSSRGMKKEGFLALSGRSFVKFENLSAGF